MAIVIEGWYRFRQIFTGSTDVISLGSSLLSRILAKLDGAPVYSMYTLQSDLSPLPKSTSPYVVVWGGTGRDIRVTRADRSLFEVLDDAQ